MEGWSAACKCLSQDSKAGHTRLLQDAEQELSYSRHGAHCGEKPCNPISTYLGGPLQAGVEAAGDGREDGSTRRMITTCLEETRRAVLSKALEEHPDQSARPVWANPQLDKLSQGWLLAMPGPQGFSHAEFGETVARLLCLPSPCCQPKVGAPLGERGLVVDTFGDNLMSVKNIPGDSYRHRHDKVKTTINSLCLRSGIRAECEVFGGI